MEESFEVIVRTYLAAARTAHDEGRISFLPYTNGSYFKPHRDNRPGNRDIDVFILEVSPPDENGFLTFGPHAWQKRSYTGKARTIIAEIDENLIRTCGDTSLHVSEVDYLVDLIGQITCETQFGPRLINGPGGQPDFHIGAFLAPGGRAVSLMLSTWGDGAVSTIVPYLDHGSIVTIPRVFSDIIITEYGVADLVGKTHRERARELIRIAHPDFRSELDKAAKPIC
ncbi:MAG: acetyl-CoA hydrolase/transferase C-terminal domain-containing protein [Pseudomonadota bacterium]